MGTVLILAEPSTMSTLRSVCERQGDHAVFLAARPTHSNEPCEIIDLWRDPDEVASDILRRFGAPKGLVNCVEAYVEVAEQISQRLRLPTANGAAAATLRNKAAMKTCWSDQGVRTPSALYTGSGPVPQIPDECFPLVVKPTFGAASAAVTVVDNMDQLHQARNAALRFNISALGHEHHEHSGILVEEFVDGPEYCVDQVWADGVPVAQGVLSKGVPHRTDLLDRLYMADPDLPGTDRLALLDIATRAIHAVGVRNGATHTEIRQHHSTGELYVIEAALRPGAGSGIYPTYEQAYAVPFFAPFVAACSGSPVTTNPDPGAATARYYWYNAPYTVSGHIVELGTAPGFYARHPYVSRVTWRRRPGDYLPREGTTYGYLAWLEGVFAPTDDPDHCLRAAVEDLVVKVADD